MDGYDKFMTIALADLAYMSIFNDFDETIIYSNIMFHGMTINSFSMITTDSITDDNHEITLGTGINDFEIYTGAHTNVYSGQVEGASGLFGDPINTVRLLPQLLVLIVTMNPMLRMNCFLILSIYPVLMIKYILNVMLK